MHNSSHESNSTRDLLALSALPGVGDIGVARRLSEYGSPTNALAAESEPRRDAAYQAADAMQRDAERTGARILGRGDALFPSRLLELHYAPTVVFARGTLLAAEPPAVAIVGTRNASSYGLRVARAIADTCARAGVSVVSGLARGIDGAAHEAALAAGGRTVAVLGTGTDVHYPRFHRALQETIATQGLLISELPPGTPGNSGTFPRRNRLIAALADVTVVVEAGEGSGALITADCALELGRTVACVPNAIDVPTASGSNALLKKHAEPILTPDDVLALLNLRAQPTAAPILDGDAASVWSAVSAGIDDLSAIALRLRLPMRAVAGAVSVLELEGLIIVDATGIIRPATTHVSR